MEILTQCLARQPTIACGTQLADENVEEAALQFVDTLYDAGKNETELRQGPHGIFLANSWKQHFVQAVFKSLQNAIETGRTMGGALQVIYEKVARVVDSTGDFAKDNVIHRVVITLGILVLLFSWKIEAFGFAEGGILEGKKLLPTVGLASLPWC